MTEKGLPESWTKVSLGYLGDWQGGGTPRKSEESYWGGDIPWVSPKDMKVEQIRATQDYITPEAIEESSTKLIPEESVLIVTRSGILAHSLPVATATLPLTINQDLKAITPHEDVNPTFLAWALRASEHRILRECSKDGTTVHSIEMPRLYDFEIPLAPAKEQHRIVAKIEELFSELDNGIQNLETARQQLAVYRQALLKQAFEGKLTARWREEHKAQLPSQEELLATIEHEQKSRYAEDLKHWQSAVALWESNSKQGRKPRKPTRPKSPTFADTPDDLFPSSWAALELRHLAHETVLGKMLDKEKNTGRPRPYLGNRNVRWGSFDLTDIRNMKIEDSEVNRYSLKEGDLVICEGGEPGRCAIWKRDTTEMFIQKALHRVRFTESYDPYFAYYYMVYGAATHLINSYFTGSTIKHLTGRGLGQIPFPLCSLPEQRRIVQILDEQFSHIATLDQTLSTELEHSVTIRHAILKRAFSGQLVSQDPTDEPASLLLERIQAERKTDNNQQRKTGT